MLAEERAGRRRFPRGPKVLIVATMAAGTVVSCDASRLQWARTELGRLDRTQLFTAATAAQIAVRVGPDGQSLAGPDLKFVCAKEELRPAVAPAGVQIEVVDGRAVAALYRHSGFRHALFYLTGSPRPDMVAAVARVGAEVVGIAGASADCDTSSGANREPRFTSNPSTNTASRTNNTVTNGAPTKRPNLGNLQRGGKAYKPRGPRGSISRVEWVACQSDGGSSKVPTQLLRFCASACRTAPDTRRSGAGTA